MSPRTYLAIVMASALALLPALPAGAQSPSTVSGTIQAIYPATSTTPEEIGVAESGGTILYALSPQTTYNLSAAGLASAPAVASADLAVGEQVQVTLGSTESSGVVDAAAVALDAQITMGQIESVSSVTGQPTAFSVLANGQSSSFTTASDAVVAPSGTTLAVGQGAVVYSLSEGGSASPATAFVVDLNGAYPPFSGTIASANGTALDLTTSSGALSFAYTSTTPVSVGQTAATDAYLLPGASASVTYSVNQAGATASAISLASTTVAGTITGSAQVSGATDLTVSTASGTQTVVVLSTTSLGGATAAQLVQGASITATGVQVGTTLTAVSLSVGQAQATGTITAVSPGASITVSTSSGPMTFALASSTTVAVGTYAATDAYLLSGEQVTVAYQTATASGVTTFTATSVTIAPQSLSGTVGPNPTAVSFTVTPQSGSPVTVTVAPDATVTGTVTAGASVSLSGVSLSSTSFEAFTVTVSSTPSQPPTGEAEMVVGKIASISGQSLVLTGRDGQSYDLTMTSATTVNLGRMTAQASILAPGEWARVRIAPDATTANQTDAVAIYLFPRTAVGVVESVATTSAGTVLTVRGRMMGHIFPVGKGHGRGEGMPDKVVGDRMLTVTVPAGTQVSILGQSGSSATTTFQTGEAIAAEGALADQGLVADQVWILPTPAAPGRGGDHGKQGNRGDHGKQGKQGNRGDHGKQGKQGNRGDHGKHQGSDHGKHGRGRGQH